LINIKKKKFICTGKKSFPELRGVILVNSANLEETKKMKENLFYSKTALKLNSKVMTILLKS